MNLIEHKDTRITHLFDQYHLPEKEVKRSFLTKNYMNPTETAVSIPPERTFKRPASLTHIRCQDINTSGNEKNCQSVLKFYFKITSLSTALSINLFSAAVALRLEGRNEPRHGYLFITA